MNPTPSELQFSAVSTTPSPTGTLATFDYYNGTFHPNLQIGNNGQTVVGPEMTVPLAVSGDNLTVETSIGMYNQTDATRRTIDGNTNRGLLALSANTNTANGSTIEMYGYANSTCPGQLRYTSSLNTSGAGHVFSNWNGTTSQPLMTIYNNGAVSISDGSISIPHVGSSTYTNGYRLYVQYGILTEQVRVALNGSAEWSDYVFAKNYKLMPLNKLENYVNKNKHLPDVPSAEDVRNEGIDLGSMDAKLLQKIEELTLYVINQEKRIDELQKKLDEKNKK